MLVGQSQGLKVLQGRSTNLQFFHLVEEDGMPIEQWEDSLCGLHILFFLETAVC